MNTSTVFAYIFVLLASIIGFVGLVVLFKGFLDRENKRITLGTILVCVSLAFSVTLVFFGARKTIKFMRFHAAEHEKLMKEYINTSILEFHHKCCKSDTTAGKDTTNVQ